jgi:hypothetical protein
VIFVGPADVVDAVFGHLILPRQLGASMGLK